ncbi:hypothetical protein [Colwellia piezophila]|uniref:hypothetical protein n=1 Tax=Colwellia piezophila TaxID=211668 RepID=UPI0012F8FCD0|nr:hypothetical protein [Colwellia piezophila]
MVQLVADRAEQQSAHEPQGEWEALFKSVMGDYIKQTSTLDYKAMFEGYARELSKQSTLEDSETYLADHRARVAAYDSYSEQTPWDCLMTVVDELLTRLDKREVLLHKLIDKLDSKDKTIGELKAELAEKDKALLTLA